MSKFIVKFTVEDEVIQVGVLLGGEIKKQEVSSVAEVIDFLHEEGKINVLDVADLVKTALVSNILTGKAHKKDPTAVMLGEFEVLDGQSLGAVLAADPGRAFEELKAAHLEGYKTKFLKAFSEQLGIEED